MKFRCQCGNVISDNTDFIPYKARLVADEDWEKFEEACAKWKSDAPVKERDIAGREVNRLSRTIYQCMECGILWTERSGRVMFFKPGDETVSKSLLRSAEVD